MAVAVVHRVAATVRGDEERVCPRAIEKRWERVGLVMIVEACNDVRPKAVVPLKGPNVKKSCDVCRAIPKDFRHELAPRPAAYMRSVLFAQPLRTAQISEIARGQQAAAIGHNIHIATSRAGDRKDFVDRQVWMSCAVSLDARQTL